MLIDVLNRHWLFGVLDDISLEKISKEFTLKTYNTGQYIFHQSDVAQRLYVILSGEISIETHSLKGKVTKITHLNEAEIFGEFALVDKGRRSASACVVKTARLASLPGRAFQNLIDENAPFSKRLLSVLVQRLRNSNYQVESLVTLSLLQRTAQILLRISDKEGDEIKITQIQLSERLFASREKVNIKLKELRRLGAIKTKLGSIQILSKQILRKLSDEAF